MKTVVAHLVFGGNCREATEFYRKCLGAELYLLSFPETPENLSAETEEAKGRIMRATLTRGSSTLLMAADILPGTPFQPGDNLSVAVHCDSLREAERLIATLGEKGTITMPLQTTYNSGASVGALTDQFGIRWLFISVASEQETHTAAAMAITDGVVLMKRNVGQS